MNRFAVAAVLAVSLAFVAFSHTAQDALVPKAEAADVYKSSLTSTDGGGSTNTASLTAGYDYSIECRTEACYQTGTSTPITITGNCATAYILQPTAVGGPYVPILFQRDFEAGGHKYVAAKAVDGGNPDCRLFQRTKL